MEDFSKVSPHIIDHLKQVYLTLFCFLITSAFGAYFHPTALIDLALEAFMSVFVVCMVGVIEKDKKWTRFVFLMSGAFYGGASLCPLISFIFKINKGNFITLLVQAALPFGCLSGAALLKDSVGTFYFHEMIFASMYLVMMWNVLGSSLSRWTDTKMLILLPLQIWRIVTHAEAIVRRARDHM